MTEKKRVGLIYSSKDIESASRLYHGLEERGVNVFYFNEEILRTNRLTPDRIGGSHYLVFCLSDSVQRNDANVSGFEDEFWQHAYDWAIKQPKETVTIIPVLLDEEPQRYDHQFILVDRYYLYDKWEKEVDRLAVNLEGIALYSEDEEELLLNEDPHLLYLWGKAAMAHVAGEEDKVIEVFDAMISYDPLELQAWYNKMSILRYRGRREEELRACEELLAIAPDKFWFWYNKGQALRALSRTEEALVAFEQALALAPDRERWWKLKGDLLNELNRPEEAFNAYNEALALSPGQGVSRMLYVEGSARATLGQLEEALSALNESLLLDPTRPKVWLKKGEVLQKLDRPEEALDAFEEVLSLKPDYAKAWVGKANTLSKLGQNEEADLTMAKAAELGRKK